MSGGFIDTCLPATQGTLPECSLHLMTFPAIDLVFWELAFPPNTSSVGKSHLTQY